MNDTDVDMARVATVQSNGGVLVIDCVTGKLFYYELDDSCTRCTHTVGGGSSFVCEEHTGYAEYWSKIHRFDLQEHLNFWRMHTPDYELPDTYDILDLGYWQHDGEYFESEDDWRQLIVADMGENTELDRGSPPEEGS